MLALRCQSTSHLTCPVLSVSLVIYSHTGHTGFMHVFIHSFIYIFMHINIQAHMTCIQIPFIHDCIDYLVSYFNCISKVSSPVVSDPEMSPIKHFSSVSFYKRPVYKYISTSLVSVQFYLVCLHAAILQIVDNVSFICLHSAILHIVDNMSFFCLHTAILHIVDNLSFICLHTAILLIVDNVFLLYLHTAIIVR